MQKVKANGNPVSAPCCGFRIKLLMLRYGFLKLKSAFVKLAAHVQYNCTERFKTNPAIYTVKKEKFSEPWRDMALHTTILILYDSPIKRYEN